MIYTNFTRDAFDTFFGDNSFQVVDTNRYDLVEKPSYKIKALELNIQDSKNRIDHYEKVIEEYVTMKLEATNKLKEQEQELKKLKDEQEGNSSRNKSNN